MHNEGHVDSWYAATANAAASCPRLQGEERADVCVIGGGYTGLSAALHLRQRGFDVVLLEAERIGWGASGRNGGHASGGQRRYQSELESTLGKEHARALWQLGQDSLALVRELIATHDIDCDLNRGILHLAWKQRDLDHYAREIEHLRRHYGHEGWRLLDRDEAALLSGSEAFVGGYIDENAAHLHALNYALGLAGAAAGLGVRLYERSRVSAYDGDQRIVVRTDSGTVMARHLVIACNGYLGRLEPRLAGLIMPINNFMIATEPLAEDRAQLINPRNLAMEDSRFVINYWRMSADRRILFGGGETYSRRFPADIRTFVRRYMLEIYPQLADVGIEYGWGGTLAITLQRLPAFGRLRPNVYHALGYSGHGVPIATMAGRLIAEAIAGDAAGFDLMARIPKRRFPGGTLLRYPGLVAGMLYYSLRDRL